MSGLLAAIRLGQAGIPYTVVEKNDGVGGTWYENRYPGARVDVGNHFYSYSFAPDDHWSEYFARQPELQAYFQHCLERYGVADHVRFATEVRRAVWDEDRSLWSVEVGAQRGRRRPRARGHRGERADQRGGAAQPAQAPRHRRARRLHRTGHALGALGGRDRPDRPAGGGHRDRGQRLPDRAHGGARHRRTSPCSSDRRRGCSPTRTTTPRSDRAWPGPCATCPTTGAGTGSCCSGRRATAAWPPCGSTRTIRIPTSPSARSTTPPARSSRSGWPTRSATTPSCWPRWCPTTCAWASARCRTTGAGWERSPATTSNWSPTRSRASWPTGWSPPTPRATSTTIRWT